VALTLTAAQQAPAQLDEVRRAVRCFLDAEQRAGGYIPEADAWLSGIDPAFSRKIAAQGWVGLTIPTRYGGHGRTELERFVVSEELLAAGAPVAAHWIADRQIGPSILRNGTEAQRQRYLPGIARAERLFAIGMSEPDSGSDLASVRTKAVEVTGGWRITGAKLWTSGAHVATNLVVLVRTDDSHDRHAGLSQFVIDLPHPDIHISPVVTIDGGHHFNEILFDDAVVTGGSLLGDRGDGWRQVTAELANERSGPERILSTFPLLAAWARTPSARTSAARLELGRLIGRLAVLRQLSFAVAGQLASGGDPSVEAAMVKDLGTTFESEVVDVVRRFADTEPDPTGDDAFCVLLAKAVLRTPAFTLRGGTNEILRSIVAKGVFA
jgi:alkylation response protein AidB-like acyl-CoA dehydrogenase